MKSIRNITIIFTFITLICLGVIIFIFYNNGLSTVILGNYSDEELVVYRKVWGDINQNFEVGRRNLFIGSVVTWALMTLMGYLFITLFYFVEIRPIRELERHAANIAKGDLDAEIPIRRGTLFSGFTESFDLMREELKDSRKREIEAWKAKKELVADLSHDIKTPVATIQATCEVMDMKLRKKLKDNNEETTEIQDNLEKIGSISAKAGTISEIMDNVFQVTMEEQGRVDVNPVEESSEVIEQYLRNLHDFGNIIFENEMPSCLLLFDKLRMEQVIDNVVGNSNKYAGTDIYIKFSEMEEQGNRYVKITIRDKGLGVSPDDLPLLTEKYFRGKGSEGKNGYGIGMYLVKNYMERQGGGLEYYNDNGFVVELLIRKV
ncbi:MAG: HAMP domain-containing histidine kinase [Eubacterium sp.]|nr:HAMP domain-containing histidine kinase [Eubacterium sp.]